MILRGLKWDPRTRRARRDVPGAGEAPAARRSPARIALSLLGLAALGLWGTWCLNSVSAGRLTGGEISWVPSLPFLAGDFAHNIDAPTRFWLAGGNPYQDTPMTFCFPYPPVVPRLFAWVGLMTPRTATVVWLAALAALATAGALACGTTRRELDLTAVPRPIVLATVLLSTPVLFALERGNFDLIVLGAVLAALRLMRDRTPVTEVIAGVVLAVAIWSKLYPGLLVLGLLALRRGRVLASVALAGGVIGAIDVDHLRHFLANSRSMVHVFTVVLFQGSPDGIVHPAGHSLSGSWRHLWVATPLPALGRIPGNLAALGLLAPLVGWVGARVFRCPGRMRLAYPFLLWILAVATFVPPVSNDYNLFFLPLAALAVWDRRDPVYVHVMMAFLLLWWQPLWLPIDGRLMLAFKLTGLLGVALSLSNRAREAGTGDAAAAIAEGAGRTTDTGGRTGWVRVGFLREGVYTPSARPDPPTGGPRPKTARQPRADRSETFP